MHSFSVYMENNFVSEVLAKDEKKIFEFLLRNHYLNTSRLNPDYRETLRSLQAKGLVKRREQSYFLVQPREIFFSLCKKKGLYPEKIIDKDSFYQRIEVFKAGNEFLMELNGNPQVCSIDEAEYHHCIGTIPCKISNKLESVLILGGGDFLAARNVLDFKQVNEVFQVEIDDKIMEIFKNEPCLKSKTNKAFNDNRLQVINADAFEWLRKTNKTFDVIIFDCEETFTSQPSSLCDSMYLDFYQLMFKKLRRGGILTYNCSNDPEEEEFFNQIFEKSISKSLPKHVVEAVEEKKWMYQKQWVLHKHNYPCVKRINLASPVVGFHSNWYFSNSEISLRRGTRGSFVKKLE